MLGSRKKFITYPVTLLLAAGVIAFALFGRPEPTARPLEAAPVPVVEVIEVAEALYPITLYSQGVISASQQIEVVAEVSGRVIETSAAFAVGGQFDANEVLLAIDDTDYRAALSQAEATLADAERLLAVERGTARQAKREWRDLNSKEANALFLRKPQIASAEAALAAARAGKEKAQADLSRTRVKLPFQGKLLRKDVDLGEYVVAGRAIAEVFALDSGEVRLPLSTDQFYKLGNAIGAEVQIRSPSAKGTQTWRGKIERVESALDPVSRLHYVVAKIESPFVSSVSEVGEEIPALALGQFVEAQLQTLDRAPLLEIPREALRQPQDIWVLTVENELVVVPVDVVERNRSRALVRWNTQSREIIAQRLEPNINKFRIVTSDLPLVYSGMQTQVMTNQEVNE